MDPIILAIEDLSRAGVSVIRCEEPFLELYTASGYPELTRGQVFSLAKQVRVPTFSAMQFRSSPSPGKE